MIDRDVERRFLRSRPSLLVSMGPRMLLVATIALIVGNIGRAADYIVLSAYEDRNVHQLTLVERAAPLWVWAILLLIGSILVLVGSLDPPRMRTLVVGHVMLSMVNFMIGVGAIAPRLVDDDPGGWRVGLALIVGMASMHFLFAVATETRRKALEQLAGVSRLPDKE